MHKVVKQFDILGETSVSAFLLRNILDSTEPLSHSHLGAGLAEHFQELQFHAYTRVWLKPLRHFNKLLVSNKKLAMSQ